MTESIERIYEDVKTLFDTRITSDREYEEARKTCYDNPEELLRMKRELIETENDAYDTFTDHLEKDVNRIVDILEKEADKHDNWIEWDIYMEWRELGKVRREIRLIDFKIYKNVKRYRRRLFGTDFGRFSGMNRFPFEERMKKNKILQQLYDGSIFVHADSVLKKYGID